MKALKAIRSRKTKNSFPPRRTNSLQIAPREEAIPPILDLQREVAALNGDDQRKQEFLAGRDERLPYDGNTAFKLYLREVGQTKLLTPLEEVQLAKKIKRGDRRAREQMIRANLRLVVKIARGYEECGLPLLDLISEGNIGLMKAVERFDPAKGAKLSTYSAWWIKQNIKHALANQSKTIRLPAHVVDKLFRIRNTTVQLQRELGREPTDEELAQEVGFSARKVARLRTAAIPPVSLETPRSGSDDDSNLLGEVIRDESNNNPYNLLEEKANASMIRKLVGALLPREFEILRLRFGLDGEPERTLEEVGKHLGVTRERVRQIQNLALGKLRKGIEKLEPALVAA